MSTGGRECRRAYLLGEHRGEAEVFVGAADPDTGRDDHLPGGVQVGEVHLVLAEVRGGVVETVHLVVVLDDPVQDRGKDCVGIRVTGVDAHTTVRVLASCTQRGNRVKQMHLVGSPNHQVRQLVSGLNSPRVFMSIQMAGR